MKTLYPQAISITVSQDINKHVRIFLATLLLLVFFLQTKAQVVPEIVFRNPVLISGNANQVGAKYRFANAANGVDVIVEIKSKSANNVVIKNIDLTGTGWDKAFQPELGIDGTVAANQNWWVEFEASFVAAGTNNNKTITGFDVTALDVDGDNRTVQEHVQMDKSKTVKFANVTNLVPGVLVGLDLCTKCNWESAVVICADCLGLGVDASLKKCKKCDGTGKTYQSCGHAWDGKKNNVVKGPVTNYLNIDTAGTAVMATFNYENTDDVIFKLGAETGATTTTAGVRMNSLWFRSFNLTASTMPVNLTSFTAKLENKNVILNWSTTQEKDFNHFLIERSVDGKEFKQAALVFADDNGQMSKEYGYKDALNNISKGIVYYRLKMVDIDGKFKYSSTRVIRLDEQTNQTSIAAYPNPAKNDLRITIPNSWQDQKVVFDLYNVNGQIVKHIVNSRAGQTENLNVADIAEGLYIVKVMKGEETAVQRIVKVK